MARTQQTTDPHTRSLLDAAREQTAAIAAAEAARFELAAEWAAAHPAPVVDDVVTADGVLEMYGDQPVTLAGEGAPGMAEFAVAEFAAATGMSAYAGRAFLGAAIECRHRLPRIWAAVMAGRVSVWKARRVTQQTHRLTLAGATYVDAELHRVIGTCSFAQIERAVATAEVEIDGEHAEDERLAYADRDRFDIHLGDAALNGGRVQVEGLLDYADALALEAQIQAAAHELLEAHPELDLDTRRAMAAGRLGSADGSTEKRDIVIYTHHTPTENLAGAVSVEGRSGRHAFTATTIEQVAEWATRAGNRVIVRPVLDLDEELWVNRYEPTSDQREQAMLTNPTCVFPHCTISARNADLDHIVPFDAGGLTTTSNLAPLCRLHHRMKTHGHWTYERATRTAFVWHSPCGDVYDVDHTHTRRRTR